MWDLSCPTGIKPVVLNWKLRVLTTEMPGKSPLFLFYCFKYHLTLSKDALFLYFL